MQDKMQDKKIALVHDHLNQMGGAEKVLLEFHHIFPKSPIYSLIYNKNKVPLFKDCKIITSLLQKTPGSFNFFRWFLTFMPSAWESFDFSKYDIVLSSTSALAKGIITPSKSLHFCYCHTPTRYLWSDTHEYVNSLRIPGLMKRILILELKKLRAWDFSAAQRVDYFIANSHFVAERIRKYYRRNAHVIYPPVNVHKCYSNPQRKKYYIVVSRIRPYKKVDLIVRAFNQLKLPIKIIGGGEYLDALKRMAKPNIQFLGEISDAEKYKYLSQAKAFIHPQEEDFGISAVEALASGCPVIAYGSGGVLETIENQKTGLFFEEQKWESLAEAVLDFDKFDFNHDFIKDSASRFSVQRFKDEIKGFIEDKLNQKKLPLEYEN